MRSSLNFKHTVTHNLPHYFTKIFIIFLSLAYLLCSPSLYANNTIFINFTPEEKKWLQQHHEVIVGYPNNLPPILSLDENQQFQGILPEYLAVLSKHSGIKFKIKALPTWQAMIDEGESVKVDVLPAIAPHESHKPYFNFTPPVIKTHFYIYAKAKANNNDDDLRYNLENIKGKRVGYIASMRIIDTFTSQHKDTQFSTYLTQTQLITALESGEIDYAINAATMEVWRKKHQITSYKIIGTIPELSANMVIATRKDWPELQSIINKVFLQTEPERKAIIEYWLGHQTDINMATNPAELSIEEKKWLKQHPIIRVGFDHHWAPIEFLGEDNIPKGVSIEYAHLLEDILGSQFEFSIGLSWAESLDKLKKGELDLIPAVTRNKQREKDYAFTPPYIYMPNGIFSAVDQLYISGLETLKNKRILVVEGYSIHRWVSSTYPELQIETVKNITEGLKKLNNGKAYAFIGNMVTTSYYIKKTGLEKIRLVGDVSYTNDLSIAVRKDWEILAKILQKGIKAIPQSKKNEIYSKWVSIKYNPSIDYTLLWQVLGISSFILLSIIYWNRRLAQEISQRRQIESELIIAKQAAEKATQAKSEFIANMSHEIRTPLNAVIGMGNLIQRTELSKQQAEYMEKMHSSSEALLVIINDILDFSKGEAGKLKLNRVNFSLNRMLKRVVHSIETPAIQKQLDLHVHIDPSIPNYLMGDSQKIGQILRNFGANAIKFTPSGSVTISTKLISCEENTIKISFSVSDTGIGISQAYQKSLFKPFSQGDSSITRKFGGTGLGLVICRQLAQLMDGTIRLESELNQGSSFIFTVNLQQSQQETPLLNAHNTPSMSSAIRPLHGVRILLVDDDKINQFLAKEYLQDFGAKIKIADNGESAINLLKIKHFDLVLMDIQMPVLDGHEATRIIRTHKQWRDLPIIALTAHALDSERKKCLATGMNDYLTKPIDPKKLRDITLKWASQTRQKNEHT